MLGLAGLWGRPASAGTLEVTPVMVELSAGNANTLVSLRNTNPEPVRYQVNVLSWRQNERGEMKLEATQDVIFFPALFSLSSGEQRSLRVGTTAPFGEVERTYRLIIEEMPPMLRIPEAGKIQMLTRLSIPVFLEPVSRRPKGEIAALKLESGRFSFHLRNTGNVRLRPQAVRAVARGAKGEILSEQPLENWYVLSGDDRLLDTEIPKAVCNQVRILSAEVTLEKGELRAELPTPRGACAP
jgi:fimbrial chaperone protein